MNIKNCMYGLSLLALVSGLQAGAWKKDLCKKGCKQIQKSWQREKCLQGCEQMK